MGKFLEKKVIIRRYKIRLALGLFNQVGSEREPLQMCISCLDRFLQLVTKSYAVTPLLVHATCHLR